jgi:predicted choloylglycine hydrolase
MSLQLTFGAVAEAAPGRKWQARWHRSWPAYRAWFEARGGKGGPDRAACEAALARHIPELIPVHAELTRLAGGSDLAARFLSTWCPPAYLGGCSLAALSRDGETRLIRNYDLSPDLNEGLLLRTAWTGRPVMGMIEFLWGLSDGINANGLAVALAFGGTARTGKGFGICTILRYVLETCADVDDALAVLERVPSHMDYNLVLADAAGRTASVEMYAGGGMTRRMPAIATNHQLDVPLPDRAAVTRTVERRAELTRLAAGGDPSDVSLARFLKAPLRQTD